MPVIDMFGGLVPRLSKHKLPEGGALLAHNVKLQSGKLEAWREKLELAGDLEGVLSFFFYGCCPLVWNTCVSATEYVTGYGRVYLSGRSDKPEVASVKECIPEYAYLGVPSPPAPPIVSGEEVYGQTSALRSYIYTYVNEAGEESGPSPASDFLTIKDGDEVRVTVQPPPPGYNINAVNIYRTGTGYRLGDEKEQVAMTDFMLVTTIVAPVLARTVIDTVPENNLGAANDTREVRVPPANLRFLSHVPDTGTLVGASDYTVHFSQDYQPWNWPAEFDYPLSYGIVNLVTCAGSVFVSTTGTPFILSGSPVQSREPRRIIQVDTSIPDISCGYASAAIGTPYGMIYSSMYGLVLVKPNGTFDILTGGWYSTEDWKKLRPDTVRLAYWRGYLFCVTDKVSFILQIDGKTYADYQPGALVTISDKPLDIRVSPNGELILLEDNKLYQWDAGSFLRPYSWESRELTFGGEASPTTAKVRTNGIHFRLLTPWPEVFYERYISNEKPIRLKRIGRHLNYRMGFYGTGTVEFADLGMSDITVNRGA